MPPAARQLVIVSGAPGAGKTTLAVPLAAELGFALIRKDRIKETLHDALGAPPPDLSWSRTLGAAAMELLWALAADARSVVLEANFRPHSDYERGKLAALAPQPVAVPQPSSRHIPLPRPSRSCSARLMPSGSSPAASVRPRKSCSYQSAISSYAAADVMRAVTFARPDPLLHHATRGRRAGLAGARTADCRYRGTGLAYANSPAFARR